jgi:hypothetical protein
MSLLGKFIFKNLLLHAKFEIKTKNSNMYSFETILHISNLNSKKRLWPKKNKTTFNFVYIYLLYKTVV